MSEDVFGATVRPTPEGPRIALAGTMTRAAKEGLESAYREASEHDGEIVLDFADVEYINSTGIAVIVGVLAIARAEGRKIGAIGLSDHYREVFQITRLSDFMHIYQDVPTT
jgi:anti-sigma B factor antagonist